MMNFTGKKVLITGGDKGIGKELTKGFIKKGVSHIAIMSRSLSGFSELESNHPDVEFIGIKGDMSSIDDLKDLVKQIENSWGSIDILVNNAGVVSAGELETILDEDIVTMIQVNLTGAILLTKYSLPFLLKSDAPTVINISSGLGLIGMPFYGVYAATKAGLKQFSDSLRREYAPQNLNVICVYPTATDTDMMTSSGRENMDSPTMVAQESIAALERGDINIVFGGLQREKDALFNFAHPEKMDQSIAEKYEELKESTQDHRAM